MIDNSFIFPNMFAIPALQFHSSVIILIEDIDIATLTFGAGNACYGY